MKYNKIFSLAFLLAFSLVQPSIFAQDLAPPRDLEIKDHAWDNGTNLEVRFKLSEDEIVQDPESKEKIADKDVIRYVIFRSEEKNGVYKEEADKFIPSRKNRFEENRDKRLTVMIKKNNTGESYFFKVKAIKGLPEVTAESELVASQNPIKPVESYFDGGRLRLFIVTIIICTAVITFILIARTGRPLKVRKIAGLNAIDEAVGRATEMGRSCLFVPGILDINDVQTIAGMNILSRVTKTAAEFNATIDVPTSKSLVMTAARETIHGAFLAAGRPDAYNEDMAYYVTDEQFGYVAFITGKMVREKPAACFYFGAFYAESLILAETGNSIGAIQVSGTAMPSQLPFFVAACDYTLIGEELFAASAYLSESPEELGSLKGQDIGKLIGACVIVAGCLLSLFDPEWAMQIIKG